MSIWAFSLNKTIVIDSIINYDSGNMGSKCTFFYINMDFVLCISRERQKKIYVVRDFVPF